MCKSDYELSRADVSDTGFEGQVNETMPDFKAKELVRGYQAGVSYLDSLGVHFAIIS